VEHANRVTEWTEDLIQLAQVAERLPAPAEKLVTSEWEERLRPGNVSPWLMAAIVGAVIIIPLSCAGVFLAIFLLAGRYFVAN
jgi:hypothetical protein